MKNKKGQVYFSALFALIVLPIVLIAAIHGMNKNTEPFNMPIGRDAAGILKSENDAHMVLHYIRDSAALAASETAVELGKIGGGEGCREINGYSLWSRKCFPDYESNFRGIFSRNLDRYLKDYDGALIPVNNYDVALSGSRVIGIARNPMTIYISGPKAKIGYYSVRPSFNTDAGYDLGSIYEELKFAFLYSEIEGSESVVNLTNECLYHNKAGPEECVEDAVEAQDSNYKINYSMISDSVIAFDVVVQEDVLSYSDAEKSIEKSDVVLRFAIDLDNQ